MPVNVENMNSEVVVEGSSPDAESGPEANASTSAEMARARAMAERLLRDRMRTRAEGFDD